MRICKGFLLLRTEVLDLSLHTGTSLSAQNSISFKSKP